MPGTAKASRVGQARRAGAEDDRIRRGLEHQPPRSRVAQRRRGAPPRASTSGRDGPRRRAEAGDARRRFRCPRARRAPGRRRAAAAADAQALAHGDQRAGALGAAELVGREDEQIRAERLRVERRSAPPAARRRRRARPPAAWTSAAASATGCSTPVSLLARLQREQRRAPPPTSARSSASRSIRPSARSGASDGRRAQSDGRRARRRARPRRRSGARAGATPGAEMPGVSARLAASVPPEVNVDLARRGAGERRDIAARASSTSARAARPSAWIGGGVADSVEGRQHRRARLGPQRRGGVVIEIDALHACDACEPSSAARAPQAAASTRFFLAIAGRPRAKRPRLAVPRFRQLRVSASAASPAATSRARCGARSACDARR